jgi:hypothetical protein
MDTIITIGLNLITSLLCFWIGLLWYDLKKMIQNRQAKHFWKPFVSGEVQIVVGRLFRFSDYEKSGFLGVGDAMAFAELNTYFTELGLRHLQLSYADQLTTGDSLQTHLILLGGPDANVISKEAISMITTNIRFGDPTSHHIALYDTIGKNLFKPHGPADSEEISTDYGAIIRAPNPFAPEKHLLLIAGSFGYGTWAGTRFAISKPFTKNKIVVKSESVECLVEADIVLKTPLSIRPIFLRKIEVGSSGKKEEESQS